MSLPKRLSSLESMRLCSLVYSRTQQNLCAADHTDTDHTHRCYSAHFSYSVSIIFKSIAVCRIAVITVWNVRQRGSLIGKVNDILIRCSLIETTQSVEQIETKMPRPTRSRNPTTQTDFVTSLDSDGEDEPVEKKRKNVKAIAIATKKKPQSKSVTSMFCLKSFDT